MTYALDENRKTHRARQLRDVRVAAGIGCGRASSRRSSTPASTTTPSISTATRSPTPNEILLRPRQRRLLRLRSAQPDRLTTINQIGNYTTPRTQEVMFGVDHELMPQLRHQRDLHLPLLQPLRLERRLIGVNSSRLHADRHADRQRRSDRSVQHAVLRAQRRRGAAGRRHELRGAEGLPPALSGLRGERRQAAVEPWMARFGFSTNSHREYFDGPTRSTIRRRRQRQSRTSTAGHVVTQTGGSGKSNIYLVLPQYQFIANGMYQCAVGHQRRRQLGAAAGLRDAVLPQPGRDRRSARRTSRACSP